MINTYLVSMAFLFIFLFNSDTKKYISNSTCICNNDTLLSFYDAARDKTQMDTLRYICNIKGQIHNYKGKNVEYLIDNLGFETKLVVVCEKDALTCFSHLSILCGSYISIDVYIDKLQYTPMPKYPYEWDYELLKKEKIDKILISDCR